MTLIGFDFSIKKPAACILKNNNYNFISWPYELSKTQQEAYKNSPITIIERKDTKINVKNVSEKLRYEVRNANYLATLIINSLDFNDKEIFLGFEGLSYGSKGDVILQLSSYKFILMDSLSRLVPLENMFTYAPITIKKTAGCSKRGMGKANMIEAFKLMPTKFSRYLKENESLFKTKFGNWIGHLDDLVDAFFVLKTLEKNIE